MQLAAARKFVRPEQLTWLVIGHMRKIDLNWGNVVVLDAEGDPVAR